MQSEVLFDVCTFSCTQQFTDSFTGLPKNDKENEIIVLILTFKADIWNSRRKRRWYIKKQTFWHMGCGEVAGSSNIFVFCFNEF